MDALLIASLIAVAVTGAYTIYRFRLDVREAALTDCPRCGTKVPRWFIEKIEYTGLAGDDAVEMCFHCSDLTYDYPLKGETEDRYVTRRRAHKNRDKVDG